MEGIVKGIIKLNPLTEIIFLVSVSVVSFTNDNLTIDIMIEIGRASCRERV